MSGNKRRIREINVDFPAPDGADMTKSLPVAIGPSLTSGAQRREKNLSDVFSCERIVSGLFERRIGILFMTWNAMVGQCNFGYNQISDLEKDRVLARSSLPAKQLTLAEILSE